MIRHIVMVKLPEDVRTEALDKIALGMAPLPSKLPEIKYMDVGCNINQLFQNIRIFCCRHGYGNNIHILKINIT